MSHSGCPACVACVWGGQACCTQVVLHVVCVWVGGRHAALSLSCMCGVCVGGAGMSHSVCPACVVCVWVGQASCTQLVRHVWCVGGGRRHVALSLSGMCGGWVGGAGMSHSACPACVACGWGGQACCTQLVRHVWCVGGGGRHGALSLSCMCGGWGGGGRQQADELTGRYQVVTCQYGMLSPPPPPSPYIIW